MGSPSCRELRAKIPEHAQLNNLNSAHLDCAFAISAVRWADDASSRGCAKLPVFLRVKAIPRSFGGFCPPTIWLSYSH
jgi:hypothetical protein